MFDYTDDHRRLTVERGSLLWCLRIWEMGQRRPPGPAWQIAEVLSGLGAAEAAPEFDCFMQTVTGSATRIVTIGCVYGRSITADEHALLDVLALQQEGRAFETLLLLRGMVTPAGAIQAAASARAFAMSLTRAGRFLDAPELATRRFALAPGHSTIRPTTPAFGVGS